MGVGSTGERFWQVQAVFGCVEHPGPGFAYTIGLADRGLRELHMWDRPTLGDDPGADFALSSADLGSILNQYADEWVTGALHIGDVRELSLDDGLTTAVVTFGEPVDADSVEAWGARPSDVVPLRWSLHRPPRGEPVPILEQDRGSYESDARLAARASDQAVTVTGARPPGHTIVFPVDGRYGPLSALVEAHATAMAGTQRIDALIKNALAAESGFSPKALLGRMTTMSRLSGRDEQLGEVELLAVRSMNRLEQRRAWRDHVADIALECDSDLRRMRANMRDLVLTSIRCTLTGLALDDVLPEEMVLASQGPWRAVLSSTGTDPGERWRCPTGIEQSVRRSFAPMHSCSLLDVAHLMSDQVADLLGDDLMVVSGRALTHRLAPPPVTEMVRADCIATASYPQVFEELTLYARLLVAMECGELAINDTRLDELTALLRDVSPRRSM